MLARWSRIELALRDTLWSRANAGAFDRLARLHHIPRPGFFSVEAWRRFGRAVLWGPRGTPGSTFDALEGLWSDSTETIAVTLATANPDRVTGAAGAFGVKHLHRLVRLRFIRASSVPFDVGAPVSDHPYISRVFFSVGPALTSGQTSAYLELSEVATSYWEGAAWDRGEDEIHPSYQAATLEVLPFLLTEPTPGADVGTPAGPYGAPLEVQIHVERSAVVIPPTYLLDPGGVDRATVDASMPGGGIIMDQFNIDDVSPTPPTGGNQTTGPYPVYLAGDELGEIAAHVDPLLASGCRARVILRDFDV